MKFDEKYLEYLKSLPVTRREMLWQTGMGFGALALASLAEGTAAAAPPAAGDMLAEKAAPLPGKARQVIHIFLSGGPSHLDTWDPKPALQKHSGKKLPDRNGKPSTGVAFPSPFKFHRYGKSGIEASELFSQVGAHADEMTVIRSMMTDQPAHETSTLMMNTGFSRLARPSLGAWAMYGLGTHNASLPGYIAMNPGGYPMLGAQNWGAGFLPGIYQGVFVDPLAEGAEHVVEFIKSAVSTRTEQRKQLDLLHELDQNYRERVQADTAMESRIRSFELAYDMEQAAAEAFDLSKEPESVRKMYGTGPQGRQMLLARRLIERGVRFVQCWQNGWDTHQSLEQGMRTAAKEVDQAIGALLTDLKQRGLLDSTLVVCGGEFGRTPTAQLTGSFQITKEAGRDHNNRGFSMWMAGGGVKRGYVYGATDELGYEAVENPVHIHDLHATILRLMGFDHERFTYRYAGRDFRLTDVYGRIVKDIIA